MPTWLVVWKEANNLENDKCTEKLTPEKNQTSMKGAFREIAFNASWDKLEMKITLTYLDAIQLIESGYLK